MLEKSAELPAFENVDVPENVFALVPDCVYPPSVVIPEIPVSTPVVFIAQSEEVKAIVPDPPPIDTAPASKATQRRLLRTWSPSGARIHRHTIHQSSISIRRND